MGSNVTESWGPEGDHTAEHLSHRLQLCHMPQIKEETSLPFGAWLPALVRVFKSAAFLVTRVVLDKTLWHPPSARVCRCSGLILVWAFYAGPARLSFL